MLAARVQPANSMVKLVVLAAIAATPFAALSVAQGPAASDPRIAAVLAAQAKLGDVIRAQDVAGVEALMAPDLVVNAPVNKVVTRDNVLARIKAGQISYEPDTVRTIEFAEVRGELVVVMGEEVVHPNKNAPHAGKTVHRRFTDVWKQVDGSWKLWIRQATITSAT